MALMTVQRSLEEKLQAYGNAVTMLREAPVGPYVFPVPSEISNWRDEQEAWQKAAILYDQSFHMTDFYFDGPDVIRLLLALGVNSLKNFGPNKAKQIVACNHDGFVIGDAILFGHSESNVSIVGRPSIPHWVAFHAETGDYDVTVTRDERSVSNFNKRLTYRFQVQGPMAIESLAKACDDSFPDIKFFNIGDLQIAGKKVRALNHSMSRSPGLELYGPSEDGEVVKAAVLEAGTKFGMVEGGARSYSTVSIESGWIPSPMPAIYTGEKMKHYREWLSADGFEAKTSLGGSFYSDHIEDYYQTPWDLGYGGHVKFDHEFIGREALETMEHEPHRKKVWLLWNKYDVLRIFESMLGPGDRYKYLETPGSQYAVLPFDRVMLNGKMVGLSTYAVYTVNVRMWFSLGMVDADQAVDGAEVVVVWGEERGGSSKPIIERHVQTNIRATIRTKRVSFLL